MEFGIGRRVRRVEDRRFLIGAGRYVADIVLPREAHGVLVLSPHAHARIVSVDISAAREAPGVLRVLTGADALADGLGGLAPFTLARKTRAGPRPSAPNGCRSPASACAASATASPSSWRRRRTQARDAAELVRVAYKPVAGGRRLRRRRCARRAAGVARLSGQCLLRAVVGEQGRGRSRFRQGRACRAPAAQEPAPLGQPDGAARARSATIVPATTLTRSTPRRRTRMACAPCWRHRCCTSPRPGCA